MAIPKVGHVLNGWLRKQNVTLITKEVVNHKVVEVPDERIIPVNAQPMPTEKVARKPEEQRSWKWWTIYTKSNLELKTDDIIIISLKRFRVQSKIDYSEAGYYEYEAILDYQISGAVTT